MNKSKGFTLVELIVVLVIVVLLILILVPSAKRSFSGDQARRAVCMLNLKSLDAACYLYANSSGGKYPIGWRHEEDKWDVADKSHVTPEDSFTLLVHLNYLPAKVLICPDVGGEPATDEWELVGLDGNYEGDPGAAAEAYIHYAYQDVGVGDGKNYLPGPDAEGGWPIFADRGERLNPSAGYYQLTGNGSANHCFVQKGRGCRGRREERYQNVVTGAHGVVKAFSDSRDECLVGYVNGELGDNIYSDTIGANDTYLLSSEAQTGKK